MDALTALLAAEGLVFAYPDGTHALRGVSLAVPAGKRIAVLGPNGAGKSTLFLHFNGILRPRQGCIRLAGERVNYSRHGLKNLRRQVGVVFQDPESMLFSADVFQEVSFGPLNLGLAREEVMRRVLKALDAAGAAHLRGKPAHCLSYGQKKRVAIASVLAMEPQVIIFDEPTAYLDPRSALQVMELIGTISRQGKTVVYSTHDVDIAYSWADYVYVLAGGKVVGAGTPVEVFQNRALLEASDLARPWLLDVYEDLGRKGWLNGQVPAPRTGAELLRLIPPRRGSLDPGPVDRYRREPASRGESDSGVGVDGSNKPSNNLRKGYTTGTCAAAAARAAVLMLQTGRPVDRVDLELPDGREVVFPVTEARVEPGRASCAVIKDAGDDPDVTHGLAIHVAATRAPAGTIAVEGGPGVGVVTRAGLAVPVGEPAINPGPRRQIREAVAAVLGKGEGVRLVISVPGGEQVAARTMNPRLGIKGGISILGTTGIVEPMSEEAYLRSLIPQLDVAAAAGLKGVVLTPGRKGQRLAEARGFLPEAVVLTSNFIGAMGRAAAERGLEALLLFGHHGKLVKIAAGSFNTHSSLADGRLETIAAHAALLGAGEDLVARLLSENTTEAALDLLSHHDLMEAFNLIAARASRRMASHVGGGVRVGTAMYSLAGEIIGSDPEAAIIGGELGCRQGFS